MQISLQEVVGKGYANYWNCKKRIRAVKGSRGSKKSKTTALNKIVRIMEYTQANLLCVRRYSNTLRDSMYADLIWAINRLGLSEYFYYTTSPLAIVRKSTGQRILFRGLDDGLKITSITVAVGVLCWVWIEEAYEIEEDDFDKLEMSVRGAVPDGYFKQITLTFNPWSANSWLKSRFFDTYDEDVFTMTTTYECNEWLDSSDIRQFKKMKDKNPRRYAIEGMGEWGISEGLIYTNFKVEEFDAEELRKKENIKSAFGLDFGYTDPNAFICMFVDLDARKIYIFDEWYQGGVTNRVIAEQIRSMGFANQRIICDSAEPKSINELRFEYDINAESARKGRDSVNHGIKLIQDYEIIIHPKCIDFQKEINNYCYTKDRHGKSTDKPDHEFSHGMDAMRYAIGRALLPDTFSWE